MHEILHIVFLFLIPVITLGVLVWDGGPFAIRLQRMTGGLVPLLILAVIAQLILNMNGVPILEWLIPMVVVLICASYCKSESVFRLVRWSMFVLAVLLCGSFLSLVAFDYTTRPEMLTSLYDARTKAGLRAIARDLRQQLKKDEDVAPCPVTQLLGNERVGEFYEIQVQSRWHTWVTRVYKVERYPVIAWYVGDVWEEGEKSIELR